MAGILARRWPLLVVGIGLGLVVFGGQLAQYATLPEFTYSVEATTQTAATDAADAADSSGTVIYQFAELPATAQDAFLQAFEAPDNRTTIRGTRPKDTALTSASDASANPGYGRYYVEYQEQYYEFTVREPMRSAALSSLLGYAFAGLGVLFGVWGSFEHESTARILFAHLSGVAAFFAVSVTTGWWGLNTFLGLVVVGAACTVFPATGVWAAIGTLRS